MTTSTFRVSHVVRGSMLARETVRCFSVTADHPLAAMGLAMQAAGFPSGGTWSVAAVDSPVLPGAVVRELPLAA